MCDHARGIGLIDFVDEAFWSTQCIGIQINDATGHKIDVFGPPPEVFKYVQPAQARLCVDKECLTLDIEQIYLEVGSKEQFKDVLLYSFDHLDAEKSHVVSMELLDHRTDDTRRAIAVSRLEYTFVESPYG